MGHIQKVSTANGWAIAALCDACDVRIFGEEAVPEFEPGHAVRVVRGGAESLLAIGCVVMYGYVADDGDPVTIMHCPHKGAEED